MNEKLDPIKKRFAEGTIKQQHLEAVVYKEIYDLNPDKFRDACCDGARLRCEASA